jgi:hypothetical protein
MSFICHHWASDMRFKITGGTAIHEYAEECATATDALDRVRTMMASDLPNIRIWKEGSLPCSLDELKGLAELENEADDA